jgi:hypothetical protein
LENRREHASSPVLPYSRPAHDIRRRVEKDNREVAGEAEGRMIKRLGLLPDGDRLAAQLVDQASGEGQRFPVSLQAERDAAKMFRPGFFAREGLSGMERSDPGALFLDRLEQARRQKPARVKNGFPRPIDPAAGQA